VLKLAGLSLSDQVRATAEMLRLNRVQTEWLSTKLPRGTFVMRYSIHRFPKPYLLTFQPLGNMDERIGEEEASKISELSLADLPWSPRWLGFEQAIEVKADRHGSDIVEKVFRHIAEHPDEIREEMCSALRMDASTLSMMLRELGPKGGRGLVEADGKVMNYLFHQLTAKGREAAKERGYKVWSGHASPAHAWLVAKCFKGLGRVYRVSVVNRRHAVNGRRPDGLYRIKDKCIAVQVCGCGGNYGREAKALIQLADGAGIDMAILVATHRQHAKAIKKALSRMVSDACWEQIAVYDAAEVLNPEFDWRTVIG